MNFQASFTVGLILAGLLLPRPAATAETLDSTPDGSFSIVLIPDTQAYKGEGIKGGSADNHDPVTNPIFAAHTKWIVDNLGRQKIAFVSHVGDIVDINDRRQWKVARECMDAIHDKVPYGISVGNHDMTTKGDSSLFQEYFPQSRFEKFSWYGGCFPGSEDRPQISGNNANSYQLFTAGGLPFVFLHLECNAPDDVVKWANEILDQHKDRRALITCHMGWGPRLKPKTDDEYVTGEKGRMEWVKIHGTRGNSPQQLWEKCYRRHPHLIAVFSGDQSRTQAYHAATAGDHGNVIHEFMQDYSTGWLRLYRFQPTENRIRVFTFDPKTEELCPGTKLVKAPRDHQFEIQCPLLSKK
ncbi:MAG: Calcineurin-like phosphoesterase [Schlesneria sp.]|nr:Calcineurin-like phosphoesterase [Schlesneria sp.]